MLTTLTLRLVSVSRDICYFYHSFFFFKVLALLKTLGLDFVFSTFVASCACWLSLVALGSKAGSGVRPQRDLVPPALRAPAHPFMDLNFLA